ncbi:hypothetical protein H257_04110 [Aphanomyces astaci]|uniref:Uncharacterized protein n=1 Tax=Aphanomyces astaci TaxID=112090 RepID=W4GVL7_APHAT|nr:hypothetical protein H257_04110 [Aphanomyces astaci]ETV83366.1 hypothetical protein H257_04110 [Aphanomyces astaci]|eukprot:XP_009826796.1 hypothetical protein H257_04110 [Aphanomyces astaci]
MTSVFQAISRRFSSPDAIPMPTPTFTLPPNDTVDPKSYPSLNDSVSKSECLLLLKRSAKHDLPNQCQEYIAQIQTDPHVALPSASTHASSCVHIAATMPPQHQETSECDATARSDVNLK